MKQLLFAFFCIFGFATLPAPASPATIDAGVGDAGIYQTRLSNGLRVIAVEDHVAPVVHTSVLYRFGSLDELPGKTGLAHALEHMMFRGTPALSAGGLDDVLARVGGQMNGTTDYDYTSFLFDMPSDRLDVALQIEADRMQHASLHAADWAIEQGAVLNEIDGDYSSPFYNLLARVRAAAYPDEAAGRTPAGVRADVAGATAADLRAYYERWYAPNNATLVVAGDVQHAAVFALAKKWFGAIPARALPAHAAGHPHAVSGKVVEAEFPFPFEVLDLAYAIPGDTEPGEPAISTLASLIPNQRGPFYQALVQTNIAVELQANADTQLRGGLMHVFVVLNPGHTGDEAQRIFQSTMDRVLKDGFDPQLVAAARRSTLADRVYSADSIAGYADLAGYTYGIVGERDADEDARLAALTPADLLGAARTYLSTPNVVGHLTPNDHPPSGSQKSTASVADDFSGRAPSGPIVEPARIRAEIARRSMVQSKAVPVEFTLPNGIRVILQQKTDRPTVYVGGEIASSPSFVPQGKEGIDRLASAVANFGTQQYDFTRMRVIADDLGASITVGADFSAHGLSQDFETLLNVLADGAAHPTFPQVWLAQERSQLANSVQSEEQISGIVAEHAYLSRLLSPGDPQLRFASEDSVASITRQDLLDFTSRYWRPEYTTIAIVGDVTPERARRAVAAAFGSWHATGAKAPLASPALPPAHTAHAYISTAANEVFVELGQPAVAHTNRDYDAFRLLSEILGGNGFFESRLFQELRQKRGLVYTVASELKSGPDRGDLEIYLNAAPQNVAPAIALVRAELERLQLSGVTANELNEAKLRLVSEALLNQASASGQLDQTLEIAKNRLPATYYSTLSQRYAAITLADIRRVAREYLHPDKLIQIYAGPEGRWSKHAL
jgi:zinc protease